MSKEKYGKLREIISGYGVVVVAFSGGVDSSLVSKISYDIYGSNALAVTVDGSIIPRYEMKCARDMAEEIGIRHEVAWLDFLSDDGFAANPLDRCYLCKKHITGVLRGVADREGADAVFDGTNAEDMHEDRPGMTAFSEGGVVSPLAKAGFMKEDVRNLAKDLGLSNHAKCSNTCLVTRIPYNKRITGEKLRRIEDSEEILRDLGVRQVRVRNNGYVARIEVFKEDFPRVLENKGYITDEFMRLGYRHVALDLSGYGGK